MAPIEGELRILRGAGSYDHISFKGEDNQPIEVDQGDARLRVVWDRGQAFLKYEGRNLYRVRRADISKFDTNGKLVSMELRYLLKAEKIPETGRLVVNQGLVHIGVKRT